MLKNIYADEADVKQQEMMMMKMMNCFCGMVDRQKTFSLISSRDRYQRSSPLRISDTKELVELVELVKELVSVSYNFL